MAPRAGAPGAATVAIEKLRYAPRPDGTVGLASQEPLRGNVPVDSAGRYSQLLASAMPAPGDDVVVRVRRGRDPRGGGTARRTDFVSCWQPLTDSVRIDVP